ncbi:MAG: DUF3833 domain-containing protein, partial [Hydrogenophaga sp.]|nr:DUF3833 domain-containing protein [Hydrogenophaga sp.]
AGCASPSISDFAGQKPELDLRTYFNGTLDAYGVFLDRSGKVARRFTVVMRCTWEGDEGVLDEDFTYSDGTTEKRVWRLKHLGNFRWGYTLALPVDGKVYEVQFDDWMYLMDDRVMLNKAVMSKFGIRLGEVMLSFVKRPA